MSKLLNILLNTCVSLIVILCTFSVGAPVFADETEAAAVVETDADEVTEPGILPDSGFYFMKNWSRNLQLMFAGDDAARAKLRIKFASEDALALKKLCEMDKCEVAERFAEKYSLQVQNAVETAEQAGTKNEEGKSIELVDKLEQNYLRQQQVLLSVLEKAPESAHPGLLNAIENSSRHVEKFILANRGEDALAQYREQIQQQTQNYGENTRIKVNKKLIIKHGNTDNATSDNTTSDNSTAVNPDEFQIIESVVQKDGQVTLINTPDGKKPGQGQAGIKHFPGQANTGPQGNDNTAVNNAGKKQ